MAMENEVPIIKKYLTEFIGTFFLVFAVVSTLNPLAIGLTYAVMIYMGGHISGGHYNPAVTIAAWLRGTFEARFIAGYFLIQLLGAFCAAAVFKFISGHAIYPLPAADINIWQAILVEALGTFLLCIVVLATVTSAKLKGNYIYGFAIGIALACAAFMGGAISGGAFNPAVGAGTILLDVAFGGASLKHLLVYLTGPFIGGIVASYTYNYLDK